MASADQAENTVQDISETAEAENGSSASTNLEEDIDGTADQNDADAGDSEQKNEEIEDDEATATSVDAESAENAENIGESVGILEDTEADTEVDEGASMGVLSPGFTSLAGRVAPTGSANDGPRYGQISLVKFIQVANGCMGGMALDSSGQVWSWGYNLYGQLGIGKVVTTQSYYGGMKRIPYFPQNGISVKEIGSSYESRYALGSDGMVYAWGHGSSGAMGNGSSTLVNTVPQRVPGIKNIEHIFVSDAYINEANVFALAKDGTLWAWGDNNSGQLGIGNTATQTSPQKVSLNSEFTKGKRNIVKVAHGARSAYILDDSGDLWSAGSNTYGEQGTGSTSAGNITTFTKMDRRSTGMGRVVDIDVSYARLQNNSDRIVAADEKGNVWEWGTTFGDGSAAATRITKPRPQKIMLDPSEVAGCGYTPIPKAVVASEMVGYFIDQYGRPWGWGSGYYFGFGSEGGYEDSNSELIKSTAAKQVPKIMGDGDTQIYASTAKLPVYKGGTRTADGHRGYGLGSLHPTIYDEKYMLKDGYDNVLDEKGRTLKYASAAFMDGVSGLTIGKYYLSSGGSSNTMKSPATESMPAVDPNEKLWIDLANKEVPFIAQMDVTLSAYSFLDADGNLFKWGNDGSGSIAWGWDYDTKYDVNGSLRAGLYDRYTYEVMYMRGAPSIDNISLSTSLDKKVYAAEDGSVTNNVKVNAHIPPSNENEALEAKIFSDLTELKYVLIPYDTNNPDFNVNIDSLTVEGFMDLYNAAPAGLKGEALNEALYSSSASQDVGLTINAQKNGRLIICGVNERYAVNRSGEKEYVNKDPLFSTILVDNIYTSVAMRHKGEGVNPSGTVEEVYPATNENIVKTNNDSADTGEAFDPSLFGLPLDAQGTVIGATKNSDGTITIDEAPRFGYDSVSIRSYEDAGYPSGSKILYYWQWKETVNDAPQAKTVSLEMNNPVYSAGYSYVFKYDPNGNWTTIDGAKTWSDNGDKYGYRPADIELTLKQYERSTTTGLRGDFIKDVTTLKVTPNEGGVWSFSFGSFKSYEYTYEVVEKAIPLYTPTITYPNLVVNASSTAENFSGISLVNTLDIKPTLFFKVDVDGNAILSDAAQFSLTNETTDGKVLDVSGDEQSNITLSTELTEGSLVVPIQKPGTYRLTETKSPAGYSLLTKEIVVVVANDGSVTATLGDTSLESITMSSEQAQKYSAAYAVTNRSVSSLPFSGGMGTLALLALSAIFIFAAAFMLRRQRRGRKMTNTATGSR